MKMKTDNTFRDRSFAEVKEYNRHTKSRSLDFGPQLTPVEEYVSKGLWNA